MGVVVLTPFNSALNMAEQPPTSILSVLAGHSSLDHSPLPLCEAKLKGVAQHDTLLRGASRVLGCTGVRRSQQSTEGHWGEAGTFKAAQKLSLSY